MEITQLLQFAHKNNASDVHISAGMPPMIRVDGEMKRVNVPAMSNDEAVAMIYELMTDQQRSGFERNKELDYSFELPNVSRFRVNVLMQQRGIAAVMRFIPVEVLTLEQLGAPRVFEEIASAPRGIVLVTGPTGSGKSTTLAAMIDHLNKNQAAHILTIEDPIEFVHESKKSLINQRELHAHTNSLSNALRAALREDPDVILVGELRDPETISLALTAAETGHLVFGTLHTNSAPKTIDRIIDVFPGSEKGMVRSMLSESLRAVISQTLLKKPAGGRVAAHEIMLGTPSIRNLIREDKVPQMYSAIQTGAAQGMQTLDQALRELVRNGEISRDVGRHYAQDADFVG